MPEIPCMPLRQLTDGPLFSAGPGTLSALTNMELRPGGYAEARGGFEEDKPNGGTAADAISAGGYSDLIQVNSSYGWVRTFDSAAGAGSQYSANRQFHQGGWAPFPTSVVTDACYFGSDSDFTRIKVTLISGLVAGAYTWVYEYWNGSSWSALTTAETITWTTTSLTDKFASWTLPTDWAYTSVGDSGTGNVYKKWMRIRVTAAAGLVSEALASSATIYGNGMREVFTMSQSPRTSATAGTFKRHGQTGTTREWFAVNTALYSGSASPVRSASYRGRAYFVNGKEQKRYDGANFTDIGLTASAATGTLTPFAATPGKGAGVWRYYFAWGYGPCRTLDVASGRQDVDPLYGYGQAVYIGEATTTAGANEYILVALTSVCPADASAFAIYCTDDLTNVPTGQRGNYPAFLHASFKRRDLSGTGDFEAGIGPPTAFNFNDSFVSHLFPPKEAYVYDISPPANCNYIGVYQNRLFLGDRETWYWSDPFTPDVFSLKSTSGYIRLAKAEGGRHMGGIEFADQFVMFTEDQTWGLTNVDLDVPQLFPIALGVGCVAPDAIAVVDGLLIWPARDGFYAWDGSRKEPQKISGKMKETFGKMNFETHGGSKATGHNRRYDIRLSNPDYSTIGNAYRFNIDSGEWCAITPTGFASTLFPLGTIYAPVGNNDVGVLHPVWGKVDYGTGAGEYGLFLGELTTQDAGSNYTCSGTMHFPLGPGELLTPQRVMAYYQASDGWGTPSFTFATAEVIGSGVGTLNTGTPDTGSDYSIIAGTFSAVPRGVSDLQVTFSVSSAASGTVNRQRLFGAILQGLKHKIRRGGV